MIGFVTGLVAEARLLRGLAVEVGGGTPAGAAAAARRLIDRGARALISFGLAGGLDPALRPGTIIVPAAVVAWTDPDANGAHFAADPELCVWLGGVTRTLLLSTPAVIATAHDKKAWHERTGASAVDLETGAIARVSHDAGVPFAALRAICDAADADLPPAALIALDAGGAIRASRLVLSLAGRPRQIPALLRLARDAGRARMALAPQVSHLTG